MQPQHLDIYLPGHNTKIEYQGSQHFEPLEFFGGEEGFRYTQRRDVQKRSLCQRNGCDLLHVTEGYEPEGVISQVELILSKKG